MGSCASQVDIYQKAATIKSMENAGQEEVIESTQRVVHSNRPKRKIGKVMSLTQRANDCPDEEIDLALEATPNLVYLYHEDGMKYLVPQLMSVKESSILSRRNRMML